MRVRWFGRRFGWTSALLPLLGGCNIASVSLPQEGRIVVETSAEEPLLLVIASEFSAAAASLPGLARVQKADTILVARPYEGTFSLQESGRILVRLVNLAEGTEAARLEIFLDGNNMYDASRELETGEFLQYAYQNNTLH